MRDKIWMMAIPPGRTIYIEEAKPHGGTCTRHFPNGQIDALYTIPAILQTSHESRECAKKVYDFLFEGRIRNYPNGLWIDVSRDLLTFYGGLPALIFYDYVCQSVRVPAPLNPGFSIYTDFVLNIRKPLKEKLAMIAFEGDLWRFVFPPKALDMMGKPDHIILRDRRGNSPGYGKEQSCYPRTFAASWGMFVTDAIRLQYLEPKVDILTCKALRAHLVSNVLFILGTSTNEIV